MWGGGGHGSVVSFFKRGLHSDTFQTHDMFFVFLVEIIGGEFDGHGGITRRAEKQRSDLLTYDQTDADLSRAQQKSGYLKGLANDVRPDRTN